MSLPFTQYWTGMVSMAGLHRESRCSPEMHGCTPEVCQRSPWHSTMQLGKMFCGHENIIPMVKYGERSIVLCGRIPLLRGILITKLIEVFYRIMTGCLSSSWNSVLVGWCSRTMTRDIEVNILQNRFKKRKCRFWNGPVKAQILTHQRCCGIISTSVHTRHPKNMAELKQFCREECLLNVEGVSSAATGSTFFEVIAAKGGLTSYEIQGFTYFFHQHCECLMGVCNKDITDYNCLCVSSLSTLSLSVLVTSDHITFYGQSMQKTRKFQRVHILFLAMVVHSVFSPPNFHLL